MQEKKKYRTEKVTKQRLDKADHYRAQIQVPDKMVWAILYGSIYDRNSELAVTLRDQMGEAAAKVISDHFTTLLSEASFRNYFRQWVQDQVDAPLQPLVWKWFNKFFGDLL